MLTIYHKKIAVRLFLALQHVINEDLTNYCLTHWELLAIAIYLIAFKWIGQYIAPPKPIHSDFVAAECKRSHFSRVLPRKHANSLLTYYGTRTLWPVKPSRPTGQSGHLGVGHAYAASCEYSHIGVSHRHALLSIIRELGCTYRIHFSRLTNPSSAIVPFWFGGIETWLGVVTITNQFITASLILTEIPDHFHH